MQCWPLRSEPTTALLLLLSFASSLCSPLSIQSVDHGSRGVVAHFVIMPPTYPTLMPLFLLGLTPAPGIASDGFMLDFFAKFPNLPFANVHSLEAHLGELPHRETLLEDGQVKREVKKVKKKLFYKSKVLSEKSEDGDGGKMRIKSKILSGPTPKSKKKGKKLLFKSRLLPSPSTPLPSVQPRKTTYGTNSPAADQDYFDRFALANPVHFQQKQRSPITTNLPNEFSTMDSKVSKKRFHKLKSNFADEYGSRHFGPVSEDFFATQIVRPRVTAEKGFSAFDPFTHSPRKRRKYGHKDHFYYEETKKIKSGKEHKKASEEHKKTSNLSPMRKHVPSKVLYRKPKVGIVIKEKAVSGEVQNPSTSSTSAVPAASENELTSTAAPEQAEVKSLPFLEEEEDEGIVYEEVRATTAPPVTGTTPSTTTSSISTSPSSVTASKSTTTRTTTLPSSSVSSLPPLARTSYTSTLNLRYRITPSPSPPTPALFHRTYLGAPHQQPFDFNTFMTVPRYLPRLPDIPKHHTPQAPKHTKSFTKYLTRSTVHPSPPPSRPTSILPPYTPASPVSTPSPRPWYNEEEFFYSNDELDEEVKTYDSNFDLLKVRPRSPPKSTTLKTTKSYKYRVLPSITLTSSPSPPLSSSSPPPPPPPSPSPYIPTYVSTLRPRPPPPYIPSGARHPHPADNLHIYKDPYNLPPQPPPLYQPYRSKPPHPADSLHIYKNAEDALAALYPQPPPRPPVYLDHPSPYLPPILPAPPATAGYIPPAPLTHYIPPSTPNTLLKNGKYKSKIHYKPKGETSRKDVEFNDEVDSVPKEMPRNMIIKGDFFETIGDPDVRLRELTSESLRDRDFEQEYTETRAAVNESIFKEEKERRIESISNLISLEETLERPSTRPIETTVETLGIQSKPPTGRPKRKSPASWPTKESFKRKFKPSEMTHVSPRENSFLSDSMKDRADKRFGEDDQSLDLNNSQQMSVSQQLEKLMSKAVFQTPTFLRGFTPSPRYTSAPKKALPSKPSPQNPPLPSSAFPPTNEIPSSLAPAKEKKVSQYQKKKLYNYEVERPRYEGNPKRMFLKPVRLDPESMLKVILDKYRGKKNYALQQKRPEQRHSLPAPRKKKKQLSGYTTPRPFFPAPAKPLQRLPKSLFSDTGKDVTSTPPSSQDTYRKFLNKLNPSRTSISSSSSSSLSSLFSSSSDLETVLERPSR